MVAIPKTAAGLLRLGLHIFPTVENRKAFIDGLSWSEVATCDPNVIAELAKKYPGCSWSVATGPSGLLVLDIDGDAGGENSVMLLPELPITREAKTPHGRHLYYRGAAKTCADFAPWAKSGLDCRSVGGMCFAPPLETGSGGYSWANDLPIVDAPDWLVNMIGQPKERSSTARDVLSEDTEPELERARRYLEGAEPAVQGAGGDTLTYQTACAVREFGISETRCLSLMTDHWNDRCQPPWTQQELWKKIQNAYNYAQNAQGEFAAERDFPVEQASTKPADPPMSFERQAIEDINQEFTLVHDGGNVLVYRESIDPTTKHTVWRTFSIKSFEAFLTRKVEASGKTVTAAKAWLESHWRKTADWVVFDPALPPGYSQLDRYSVACKRNEAMMNLWSGWAIKPEPGDWSFIREELVWKLLADRDESSYNYIINWVAQLFQRPQLPGQVALVLRGKKGVGKSTLGEFLYRICGKHAMVATKSTALTGDFTGHLLNKILLFADEAYWAGDRKGEGQLKTLITGNETPIRKMRTDAEMHKNRLHVLMASNNQWVVPATAEDERRYAVFDVADSQRGNQAFWNRVYRSVNDETNSELAAMLHDLLQHDISDFHPATVPNTEALAEQKMQSLGLEGEWWLEKLQSADMPEAYIVGGGDWLQGPVVVDKSLIHVDYLSFIGAHTTARDTKSKQTLMSSFLSRLGWRVVRGGGRRQWLVPAYSECVERWSDLVGATLAQRVDLDRTFS